MAPFLFKITKRIPTSYLLLTLALCLGLSEVLFTLYRSPIYDIVFMTLPYGLVYVYGLNILRFTKQTTGFVALTLLLACFSFGIYANYNSALHVQEFFDQNNVGFKRYAFNDFIVFMCNRDKLRCMKEFMKLSWKNKQRVIYCMLRSVKQQ